MAKGSKSKATAGSSSRVDADILARGPTHNPASAQATAFPGIGFPDRLRCQLKYTENGINIGGVATSDYQFRGDDLYDPNSTGTGAQPTYFDQLAAIYNKFQVLGSRIRVDYNVGVNTPANVAIVPNDDATALIFRNAACLTYAKTKMVVGYDGAANRVANRCESSQAHGIPQTAIGLSGFFGTSGASPTDPWYWHVVTESTDLVTNLVCRINVEIVYDVVFFDRAHETVSLEARISLQENRLERLYRFKESLDSLLAAAAEEGPVAPGEVDVVVVQRPQQDVVPRRVGVTGGPILPARRFTHQ